MSKSWHHVLLAKSGELQPPPAPRPRCACYTALKWELWLKLTVCYWLTACITCLGFLYEPYWTFILQLVFFHKDLMSSLTDDVRELRYEQFDLGWILQTEAEDLDQTGCEEGWCHLRMIPLRTKAIHVNVKELGLIIMSINVCNEKIPGPASHPKVQILFFYSKASVLRRAVFIWFIHFLLCIFYFPIIDHVNKATALSTLSNY